MDIARNWFLALILVLILAAPLAVGAAALRGVLNLAETYNFRRFQAAGKAAGRGNLGRNAQRFALGYLARHPGAARTLEIPPQRLLDNGPIGTLPEAGLNRAAIARLEQLGVS